MRIATGCALVDLDGRRRIPFGFEHDEGPWDGEPCPDCSVAPFQFHHWGCAVARCRDCGEREHKGECDARLVTSHRALSGA